MSNTGIKYIFMRYKNGKPYLLEASIHVDGVKKTKTFSAFQFEDNMDDAMIAAKQWIENIKETQNHKRERNE